MSRSQDAIREAMSPPEAGPGSETTAEPTVEASSALVPAEPPMPRRRRFSKWLRRVAEVSPARPAVPPEMLERLDGLEVQLAAHEEQTAKRLDENETRALHLLEQRLGAIEEELSGSLRRLLERALEKETRSLNGRIAIVAVLALVAGGVATLALLATLGLVTL
jgi:hypothetical protein